mmetsp:Transcript_63913/g.183700  ORF Transcript_63913/g.183700 Transcript_63913/m.183700 type:complete len:295 (-) Transcript_63913:1262-2146(-)
MPQLQAPGLDRAVFAPSRAGLVEGRLPEEELARLHSRPRTVLREERLFEPCCQLHRDQGSAVPERNTVHLGRVQALRPPKRDLARAGTRRESSGEHPGPEERAHEFRVALKCVVHRHARHLLELRCDDSRLRWSIRGRVLHNVDSFVARLGIPGAPRRCRPAVHGRQVGVRMQIGELRGDLIEGHAGVWPAALQRAVHRAQLEARNVEIAVLDHPLGGHQLIHRFVDVLREVAHHLDAVPPDQDVQGGHEVRELLQPRLVVPQQLPVRAREAHHHVVHALGLLRMGALVAVPGC